MESRKKRIYVGNLPFDTTENEVNKKFSRFGNVVALEIKHRSDVGLPCYAFLDLEIDDVDSCFRKLLRKKWKGHEIKLELAKESFLSRLEKERINDASHPSNSVPYVVTCPTTNVSYIQSPEDGSKPKKKSKKILDGAKIYNSEDNISGTDTGTSKDDLSSDKNVLDKFESFSDVWRDPPSEPPAKPHESDITGRKRKRNVEDSLSEDKLKIQRNLISEAKRLKSLEEKKKSFLQQKEAVQLALSSVDVNRKASNKLIFDDNEDEVQKPAVAPNQHVNNPINSNEQISDTAQRKKKTRNLFDDDESTGEEEQEKDFHIKRQFEGKKGQKLLELQSQYANDQRFALDERFYDSDENADQEEDIKEISGTDEVKRQMEILQSIVGHELPSVPERKNNLKGVDNFMLRFDPTVADHIQYETKEQEKESMASLPVPETKKSSKKKKTDTEKKGADLNPVTTSNVSKEKFYKVADTLKESLKTKESGGFSLLEMFGSKGDIETNKGAKEPLPSSTVPLVKDKQGWTSNPFKYDSSESEGEDLAEPIKPILVPLEREPVMAKGIWRENFFFKTNDTRLSEGIAFFAIKNNDDQNYNIRRRELHQIISAKVKHNLRKSEPKKRMLGGNKFKRR